MPKAQPVFKKIRGCVMNKLNTWQDKAIGAWLVIISIFHPSHVPVARRLCFISGI